MAVSVNLADDIDISRGDMLARPNNQPAATTEFDAMVCWMADDAALEPGREYVVKHTTRTTRARWSGPPARRQHPCTATRAQRR